MKKTIAVLFGGCSTEYPISLQSACAVLQAIDRTRYEVLPIGITRAGDWFLYEGPLDAILQDTWRECGCVPAAVSPSRSIRGLLIFRPNGVETLRLDGAFPVLHGKYGEDGTVQGLLELAGIPVVGCGTLASALGMDKVRAHQLASMAGVRVPACVVLDEEAELDRRRGEIKKLGLPLFVKPVRSGSSFGISRVTQWNQVPEAVGEAFRHDSRVVLEECVSGFEVGCAILGTRDLTVGQVDEIELSEGFFDYEEKYTLKTSRIHMPARIPAEKAEEIKAAAVKVYRALDCSGFARVDLFLTPEGEIIFNEVNTIPGFTGHSRYPNMMKGIGLDFPVLVERLLEEALV